jgi:hypothetical protein
VAKEGSLKDGTIRAPKGRRKKGRTRRSSSSSKATFETARDKVEAQSVKGGRNTSILPQTPKTGLTDRLVGTSSSVSRTPNLTEVEAKKLRLLAVISAAAGDVNSSHPDAETNRCDESESDDLDRDCGDNAHQRSRARVFAKPTNKANKSRLIAKRPVTGRTNGRWTPEATQGTESLSSSKRVKNMMSKSSLATTSLAANEEDDPATGLQLPTPNASSQVHGRQPLDDPFTSHDIRNIQMPKEDRSTNVSDKISTAQDKQMGDSLYEPPSDDDTSDDDSEEGPKSREPHSTQTIYGIHHSISSPGLQPNIESVKKQFLDQAMDLIDPALRDIGMDPNENARQIGIYKDIATPQTTGKRKRRLPVEEDAYERPLDSEVKSKKPRKQSLKPNTSRRKSVVREFREESQDLDAPSGKIKRGTSTQKKVRAHEPTAKGKFSNEELEVIQNEIVKYREMYDITTFDLNQIIQDNPSRLASLWEEICEALPDRPRAAIVKVCRRKFHNFGVRGKWTKEEDRELKEAYERFPKRWKQIGQVLNRHHEDVRDRWRNYIVCGDSMKREQWTEEEEDNLRAVVGECIQAVRELKAAEIARNPEMIHDPRPDIELVDWQIVSEKFGRTRSRLQCLDKWNRLTRLEDSEGGSKELELGPNSWRVKSAYKDIKHMRREDYLELLIALRNTHAGREGKVNWTKLGDLDLRIKWTCMARKVAWKKLRASVPGNEQMKFQDIVTLLLNNLPENDAELEGKPSEANAEPESPFRGDAPSPQKRSLSEAISSAEEDENDKIDPNLDELDDGYFDPDEIQERHNSLSLKDQNSSSNKDMLREVVGEAYFDSGNTDAEDEDGDMAMAEHGSVDLDGLNQQKGARGRVSRLRSPISFKTTLSQEQPEYVHSSTHSDEDDVDLDIPARRPVEGARRESVDLDMD